MNPELVYIATTNATVAARTTTVADAVARLRALPAGAEVAAKSTAEAAEVTELGRFETLVMGRAALLVAEEMALLTDDCEPEAEVEPEL